MKNPFAYLKSVRKKLKDPYWRARCKYIKYYETLPIDEKAILLESQNATKLDGNLFYIIKYLISCEKYADFKIYLSSWGRYKKKIMSLLEAYELEKTEVIVYSSDEYVRLLASAKYLFNDATFPAYFIKKNGQVYLNTWHGTPLKTMGRSVHNDTLFGNVQKNMICADYLLYTNRFSKDIFIRDYMLENVSSNSYIMGGYPRNEAFFNDISRKSIREEMDLADKRVYAYMPTWRGTMSKIGSDRERTYLMYYFYELDKLLTDDEILYINIHPLSMHAKDNIALKYFKHIRRFPDKYETYDFLNAADVLITDYSSVLFDFACTRRKIILFPYDKEEYLSDRGMYLNMNDLPFPQAFDVESLVNEMRSEKEYNDTEFVQTYNTYDNVNASQQLCDFVILGEDTGLEVKKIPDNGRQNVVIYAGNLARNGITTSLRSLMNAIDLGNRNYYISFCQGKSLKNAEQLKTFSPKVNFLAISEYKNLTIFERIKNKLFRMKLMSAKKYAESLNKRIEQDFLRSYGGARIDSVIQFCGYESDIILLYGAFKKCNAIFVHNDMAAEIEMKGNQRRDVLNYAYNKYDKVVTVSEDIIPPTVSISKRDDNIITVHNIIDYKTILARSEEAVRLDDTTRCSVDRERFEEIMQSDAKKFINIGRYSPEKGHARLVNAFSEFHKENNDAILIIMGGNSRANGYENLNEKVKSLDLENNVILLLAVSNPYPIVKACDYFIMSSFYEGLPMVLFEADMMGLPIAATDVSGPHGFLTKYGGTLVENSETGVYNGLKMLSSGAVKTLNIDYDAYNAECVAEFEKIFEDLT